MPGMSNVAVPSALLAATWRYPTRASIAPISASEGTRGSGAKKSHSFTSGATVGACIALTTDTSNLTAIGNDYGFNDVFSRQVEALARPGDVFVGISTSGNSANIIAAVNEARAQGIASIALLGRDGGKLESLADMAVIVPHDVTARIQEAHIFILHHWADVLERAVAQK